MEINNLSDFGKPLSSKDVAAFLGVSVTTVYAVAEEFGGVRVGTKYVFFENVFFDRMRRKVALDKTVEMPTLPGFDVTMAVESLKDQTTLEDRHGIFG